MKTDDVSDSAPLTAAHIEMRISQLQSFLERRGFRLLVSERVIDRVIHVTVRDLSAKKPAILAERTQRLFLFSLRVAQREATRELRVEAMNPALLAAPPAREPDDSLNRAVESALDELTTRQRNAVKFCVMFGWSLAKAAAEMRCDATTVMRHRDQGIKRLRELLT